MLLEFGLFLLGLVLTIGAVSYYLYKDRLAWLCIPTIVAGVVMIDVFGKLFKHKFDQLLVKYWDIFVNYWG